MLNVLFYFFTTVSGYYNLMKMSPVLCVVIKRMLFISLNV